MKQYDRNERYVVAQHQLPRHAYHPNVALTSNTRKGYIAWPNEAKHKEERQ